MYQLRWCVVVLLLRTLAEALAGKEVPIAHIEAVAGDPVYLPCDISTDIPNDKVLLVLWYREDLGTPIYSVDGRERDFRQGERWSDENVFANRAYFIPEKQPAELGIDHIRETDQAIYRCRVDFKIAQTRNSKVNLTVIVPPQKIVVTNESGATLTSVVGPFSEGASFTLRCDVFGGRPLPKVVWYRNDVVVSNISAVVPSAGTTRVRSELKVSALSRKDVHSELTCQASNNPRTQPLAATLHVDMNFGPLDVKILGANMPLSAGKVHDLLCQSSGSRPPASITWWKGEQRLEKTKETTSNDGNTTTSILSLNVTKADGGKYLSCRAENKMLQVESIVDGITLEVHYKPEARIILGASLIPESIREGADVYFDCTVEAQPSVYKVEWKHNGKLLHINVSAGIIVSNQSLVLQGVSRSTAGNYTCVGYNAEGEGESEPFYLNILFAPTCKPNQTRIYGVAKEEKAQVTCQVEANPIDVQFRWTFNSSALSVDVAQNYIARSGTSSTVTYTPVTEQDYGTLLCYAFNKIGHQRTPCIFHIIAAGRPDQAHNCTITNISMTSFTIKCSEGFNGGLPQSFLLEVIDAQKGHLKSNLSSPVARFFVTGLEPGMQYQTNLFSYNGKGRSEPIVLQTSTLKLPEKQHTPEKDNHRLGLRFTPIMSVLVGVISALLIIALVVILVLRLQHGSNNERRKHNKSINNSGCDHRGSISGPTLSDKGGGSPISKHDSSAGECDSDEKNPDIIPHPVDADEVTGEYARKHQHVSTIETSSPSSQTLLHHAPNTPGSGYIGYCTLRNGMPVHEIPSQTKNTSLPQVIAAPYAPCTLPRQAQQWAYGGHHPVSYLPPGVYPVQYRTITPQQQQQQQQRLRPTIPREPALIPMQPLVAPDEEPSAETPLMVNKRESTV